MKLVRKLLFIVFVLISTMAIAGAGPMKLAITNHSLPEPTQMLLLGVCLVGLASYSRKKIYKK